jgi:hypothetical protein
MRDRHMHSHIKPQACMHACIPDHSFMHACMEVNAHNAHVRCKRCGWYPSVYTPVAKLQSEQRSCEVTHTHSSLQPCPGLSPPRCTAAVSRCVERRNSDVAVRLINPPCAPRGQSGPLCSQVMGERVSFRGSHALCCSVRDYSHSFFCSSGRNENSVNTGAVTV